MKTCKILFYIEIYITIEINTERNIICSKISLNDPFAIVSTMKNTQLLLPDWRNSIIALLLIVVVSSSAWANESDPKQVPAFDFTTNGADEVNVLKPIPIKELQSALSWCNRAVASAGSHATDGKAISYQDVVVFSETGEYSCQDIIDLRFELPN